MEIQEGNKENKDKKNALLAKYGKEAIQKIDTIFPNRKVIKKLAADKDAHQRVGRSRFAPHNEETDMSQPIDEASEIQKADLRRTKHELEARDREARKDWAGAKKSWKNAGLSGIKGDAERKRNSNLTLQIRGKSIAKEEAELAEGNAENKAKKREFVGSIGKDIAVEKAKKLRKDGDTESARVWFRDSKKKSDSKENSFLMHLARKKLAKIGEETELEEAKWGSTHEFRGQEAFMEKHAEKTLKKYGVQIHSVELLPDEKEVIFHVSGSVDGIQKATSALYDLSSGNDHHKPIAYKAPKFQGGIKKYVQEEVEEVEEEMTSDDILSEGPHAILAGIADENPEVENVFNAVMGAKIDAILDGFRNELAAGMFETPEEVEEEFEEEELEEIEEGNGENKAKKREFVAKVGKGEQIKWAKEGRKEWPYLASQMMKASKSSDSKGQLRLGRAKLGEETELEEVSEEQINELSNETKVSYRAALPSSIMRNAVKSMQSASTGDKEMEKLYSHKTLKRVGKASEILASGDKPAPKAKAKGKK